MGLFNKKDKYDIKPGENIPREVYGIPNIKNEQDLKCPYCGSEELWKYLYGEPTYDYDRDKYILGGCEITLNQPTYKCKKCQKDIYPKNRIIIPNDLKLPTEEKKVIRIGIKNDSSNYVMLIDYYVKNHSYNISFCDLNNLDGKAMSDISTNISEKYYTSFVNRFYNIIKDWKDDYLGNSNVSWSIKIADDNERLISGNGGFPKNWNELIELLVEYELLFKQKKNIDIEKINDMEYDKLTFEEAVRNRLNDPFWADTVIKYFKEELKETDMAAKVCLKDLMKYDDILNEFTKCLMQKTYDLKDAIEINGYTAKRISELNPSFTASDVYSFMQLLRDDKEKAEEIIKSGFATKDSIFSTLGKENKEKLSNEELAEKYLKEIEDEVDKEMIKRGLLTIDNGKKLPAFGSCHTRWAIEKKILKERYNIDWQTPAEKNPYVKYD